MSEYNNLNFYFLKLYDWFLNSDEIRWVEKQERGAEIVIMLFRLMIVAKNKKGKIARIVGQMENPYTIKEMAESTFQTEEMVKYGLEILMKAELIVKEGECYSIPKALEFTNQTTAGALKKQKQRRDKAEKEEDICPPEIEEEKDKENRKKNKEAETYTDKEKEIVREVIEHLNKTSGKAFKYTTPNTIKLICNRLAEGYELNDFIDVINKKCYEWNETENALYIRPETLFGEKFESYVNQKAESKSFDNYDWDSLYDNYKFNNGEELC